MTTSTPAVRSGGTATPRPLWRPVILWTLFFALLAGGLVLAATSGETVPALREQAEG